METEAFREGAIGRALHFACDVCGAAGGAVLIGMAGITVASVIGRAFFDSPILGDVELVQLGLAVSISAFLPYAQFQRSNIIVDFFTTRASRQSRDRMDGFGTLLFALMMVVLAWQFWVGGMAAKRSGEVSMLMSLPIWISYMAMVPGLVLSALVGLYHTVLHWNPNARPERIRATEDERTS